jgi:peptidoglycan/LPS O-acetylase OafA/YrhL
MMRLPFGFAPGLFRLTLALLVVVSHLSAFGLGRPAVMMFFMLSGYWVPRMYEQKYRPIGSVGLFYVARLLRVWLPFAIAFLAVFTLHQVLGDPKPLGVLSGIALLGLATTHQDVLGTAWSLDIEVQFYLLVPLIWAFLAVSVRRKALPLALGLMFLLCGAGWYVQKVWGVWTVLSYLPPFITGTLIWLIKPKVSGRLAAGSVVVFVALGVIVLALPALRPLLIYRAQPPFDLDWFGMAWVMALTPFVIWNLAQKSSPVDMHFGNFSYALYITHWPIIEMMQTQFMPFGMVAKLATLAVIACVSIGFYIAIDRSCEQFRRQLIGRLSGQRVSG